MDVGERHFCQTFCPGCRSRERPWPLTPWLTLNCLAMKAGPCRDMHVWKLSDNLWLHNNISCDNATHMFTSALCSSSYSHIQQSSVQSTGLRSDRGNKLLLTHQCGWSRCPCSWMGGLVRWNLFTERGIVIVVVTDDLLGSIAHIMVH